MIELLIQIVIFCIVAGLIYYVVTLLPLPEPFKKIAVVAVLCIFLIFLLLLLIGAVPPLRIAR